MGEGGHRQTVGERIYLIREALGTRRDPMPLEKFAELIAAKTGVRYDKSVLSRKETGQIAANLDDIKAIASVDPENRGRDWLAWGSDEGGQGAKNGNPDPKPETPIREVEVEYLPNVPSQPSRQKGKPVKRRPGRSAVA